MVVSPYEFVLAEEKEHSLDCPCGPQQVLDAAECDTVAHCHVEARHGRSRLRATTALTDQCRTPGLTAHCSRLAAPTPIGIFVSSLVASRAHERKKREDGAEETHRAATSAVRRGDEWRTTTLANDTSI